MKENESLIIRPERPSDYEVIKDVNNKAFGQVKEGNLIEKLRLEPAYIRDLSLVALVRGKVVGHILFFPVNIVKEENSTPTLSLAPMSVLPDYQRKGIGSSLISQGLEIARQSGFISVVAVGHPGLYPRFGFRQAAQWGISSPWELPDGVFMALELKERALEGVSGKVEFSSVFNEVI
jgi:putative acetyltransferase